MNVREIGLENVDWINLAHNRCRLLAVNTVMNIRLTQKAGNFLINERVITIRIKIALWSLRSPIVLLCY